MANPLLQVGDVIGKAVLLLAKHPLVKNPLVASSAGIPIPITRIYEGYENTYDVNPSGLTLSIFPYSYRGTSNETVGSVNTTTSFKPHHLGANAGEALEECTLNLVVQLQAFGRKVSNEEDYEGSGITIYRNHNETALQNWLFPLYGILLSKPLMDLGGLVNGSSINWGTCKTATEFGGKKAGENVVFHTLSFIWSIHLFSTRNWKAYPQFRTLLANTTPVWTWSYVGMRNADGVPVYWDSYSNYLVTGVGHPLLYTPKGKRVVWDAVDELRFEDLDGVALTADELLDPNLDPPAPWINTDMLIVGVLLPGYDNLFYNRATGQLMLADGTLVTALEDGTPISYDAANQVVVTATNTPLVRNQYFLGVKQGRVNVYDANSLKLRESFEI